MRCQKTFLLDGQCTHEVLGAHGWCRWHRIIESFRSDLSSRPRLAAHGMMLGSSASTLLAASLVWTFAVRGYPLALLLAAFCLGTACKLFADGCIARDHPFGQFALWGKLLTAGVVLEMLGGAAAGIYVLIDRAEIVDLIRALRDAPVWSDIVPHIPAELRFGPSIVAAITLVSAGLSAKLLLGRLLFIRRPALNAALGIAMLSGFGTAARPAIFGVPADEAAALVQPTETASATQAPEASPPAVPRGDAPGEAGYWTAAIASDSTWLVWIVLAGCFCVTEVINLRLRQRAGSKAIFRATIWPSYPICHGGAVLGVIASRYAMVWLDVHHLWSFSACAVAVSGAVSFIATRTLLKQKFRALERVKSAAPRTERQYLLLFMPGDEADMPFSLEEVDEVLGYSSTGIVEGASHERGFIVVHMSGASADAMLSALVDLVRSAAIKAGTFAVLRYGGPRNRERVVELL